MTGTWMEAVKCVVLLLAPTEMLSHLVKMKSIKEAGARV